MDLPDGHDTAQALAQIKAQSLPNIVQDELERRILGGAFGINGGRINEQAFASALGISRGPVREACRSLVSRGLLEFIPNRGFFTRRISVEESREIYDLREDLESAAARRFVERCGKENLAEIKHLIGEMDSAVKRDDLDSYYPLNLKFHEACIAGTGNARLLQVHRDCVRDLHLLRVRGLVQSGSMAHSNREHKAIFRALKAGDADGAARAVGEHIRKGKERMLAANADEDKEEARAA